MSNSLKLYALKDIYYLFKKKINFGKFSFMKFLMTYNFIKLRMVTRQFSSFFFYLKLEISFNFEMIIYTFY